MNITILIADDDVNIRRVIQLYLEREGFQVKIACDGKEALDILEQEKIDCATVDTHVKKLRKQFKNYEDILQICTIRGLGSLRYYIRKQLKYWLNKWPLTAKTVALE